MVRVIRWVCESCQKKWIYPVENCIHCKGPIKKVIGTKTKVVGVSKVMVPSPFHSVVPYHVLILEDEHGHRMPKKTMKEYQIGDVFEERPCTDPHAVSIIKIKYDFFEAVDEAVELIGGADITKDTKVLIKPEIVANAYAYTGQNTNPKVIDGILSFLSAKGALKKNITVAENDHYTDPEKALGRSGIGEILKKHGVLFKNLAKSSYERRKHEDYEFEIAKDFFEADLIINVPVMKTNSLLVMTGAIENLTRAVSKGYFEDVKDSPMEALQMMAALPMALPNVMTIADASIGIMGNAPKDPESAFINMLFASNDPVAVDKIFQEMCMLRPADHVEMAAKFGAGTADLGKITVAGCELASVVREIKPARRSRGK